jgi:hypothetical protein
MYGGAPERVLFHDVDRVDLQRSIRFTVFHDATLT